MNVTIKTRRIAAGSYEVDTPSGTYKLANCPTDRSDPHAAGLPSGPRWMLTYPDCYSADSEFGTKRDAVESIRTNEQWKADQAGKTEITKGSPMLSEAAENWEYATFADFKAGDRIKFLTNDNGYDGLGDYWRTGTVAKVTAKTIAVDCYRNLLGNRATIRRADWSPRCAQKVKPGHRVEIQPFVPSRESNFDRQDMISIISEPDGTEVQKANLPSMARTPKDFESEVRLLGWELLGELTMVFGGYYEARVKHV